MANTKTSIRATIVKHQRLIMLTVAVVALAAYIVPFAHLYDVADAQKYKKPDNKKKGFDKKSSSSIKISLAQSAVQNSGILSSGGGGGSSYDGFQLGNTAFNFLQQSQQVCSGIVNCPSTQTIQFTPYTSFGQ